MDFIEKIKRSEKRKKSIALDKKNRHKQRNLKCGEYGKRFVGNSCKRQFCTFCRPMLANKLLKKLFFKKYFQTVLKNEEDFHDENIENENEEDFDYDN
jgi:hypothetical protein